MPSLDRLDSVVSTLRNNKQRADRRPLRVFALTHRVPFPPDKGDKIRTWNLLSRLARKAEVHLFCLADPPADLQYIPRLRELFASVTAAPIVMPLQKLRALPSLLSTQPLTLPVFHSVALKQRLRRATEKLCPDVFYAESSSMAPYALEHSTVPLVMDFVDVDSEKWRAAVECSRGVFRWTYQREARLLAQYEREVASHAAVTVFAAAREVQLFRTVAPNVQALEIANGVDTEYFHPRAVNPRSPSLVFVGAMDYLANVDAARYLVETVLPRVRERLPETTVVLAGSRPTRDVHALARVPGVAVTGFVPDIRPYVHGAMLSVCPLRVARGVQNKVLEAMSMGVPVVASPGAAAGIDAIDGREIVVANDDPDGRHFANAIVELATDPERRDRIAIEARQRVVEQYGWQPRAEELHSVLLRAAGHDSATHVHT
jgi:sugar transferase (PEP-CTERM/EpsH1 system associated)